MPRPRVGTAGHFLTTTFLTLLGFGLAAPPVSAERLVGRARDPHHRAVGLADVILTQGSRVVATAKTAADGRFGPLAVLPGEYELVISSTGLQSAPQRVTITDKEGKGPSLEDLFLMLTGSEKKEPGPVPESDLPDEVEERP